MLNSFEYTYRQNHRSQQGVLVSTALGQAFSCASTNLEAELRLPQRSHEHFPFNFLFCARTEKLKFFITKIFWVWCFAEKQYGQLMPQKYASTNAYKPSSTFKNMAFNLILLNLITFIAMYNTVKSDCLRKVLQLSQYMYGSVSLSWPKFTVKQLRSWFISVRWSNPCVSMEEQRELGTFFIVLPISLGSFFFFWTSSPS